MADIAELGFKVDTSGLKEGKKAIDDLPVSGAKAEASADQLSATFTNLNAVVIRAAAMLESLVAATNLQSAAATSAATATTAAAAAFDALGVGVAVAEKGMLAVAAASDNAAVGLTVATTTADAFAVSSIAAATALDQTTVGALAAGTALEELTLASVSSTTAIEAGGAAAETTSAGLNGLAASSTRAAGANQAMMGGFSVLRGNASSALGVLIALTTQFSLLAVVLFLAMQGFNIVWEAIKKLIPFVQIFQDLLRGLADAIPVIAPYLVILGAALLLIYSPAILTGLGSLIVLFGELAGSVAAATLAFIAFVGWPAIIAAAIVGLLAVAVSFRDSITHYFGVDIIGVIKDTANYMMNSLIAAYDVVAAMFSNLPTVMGAAFYGAVNLVITGVNLMIKTVSDGINTVIQLANKIPGVNIGAVGTGTAIAPIANPYADQLKQVGDDTAKIVQSTMAVDRLGQFGKAIGDGAAWAAKQVNSLADALTKVPKAKKATDYMSDAQYQQGQVDDLITKANNAVKANQAVIDSIGETTQQTDENKRVQELLNDAVQKHINLTAQQTAALTAAGKAWGDSDAAKEKALADYKFEVDTTKGFVTDLAHGLEQGKSFWQAFSDAAFNALNKITDKLLNEVVDALFQTQKAAGDTTSAFTSMGSVFSKIASSIGSFFGGGGGDATFLGTGGLYAKGGAFDGGVQRFASGAAFSNSVVSRPTLFPFANGTGLMGEAGPEAIMPLKRGSDGSLGVQMHSANGAKGGTQPANVAVSVVVNGADANVSHQSSTNPDGTQIEKFVIDVINRAAAGGKLDKSMNSRFAVKPQKVTR